jgi:hypothetical protein
MASEPQEVVDNVWKRILAFAMLEVEPVSPREINLDDWDEYFRPNEINANRLAFALVSKTFHVRFACECGILVAVSYPPCPATGDPVPVRISRVSKQHQCREIR